MIVDDSRWMRILLKKIIELYDDISIIHEADSAAAAAAFLKNHTPDVITLDVQMAGMDGVSFLKKYMAVKPIPTIMISILDYVQYGPIFEALENGAFDYIKKPALDEIDDLVYEVHEKIVGAYSSGYIEKRKQVITTFDQEIITREAGLLKNELVAIGASTGGIDAIYHILSRLPANIPPTIITQHITPAFSRAFAEKLNKLCSFKVKVVEESELLTPGKVVVAQGGKHLRVSLNENKEMVATVADDPPIGRFKPSIDYMFNSIPSEICNSVMGILLTGMGKDGAQGLFKLRRDGAMTVIQDENTCAVFDMPSAARDLGAAQEVLPLHHIARFISLYYSSRS